MTKRDFLFGFVIFSIGCLFVFYFLLFGKFKKLNSENSDIQFSETEQINTVSFNMDFNEYTVKKGTKVYLNCNTEDSEIFYAMEDFVSAKKSEMNDFINNKYLYLRYDGNGIEITKPTIIKTVAEKTGGKKSEASVAIFYIED